MPSGRVLALAMLLAASPAQASNGSIRCRVVDQAGRALDGTCTATQDATSMTCATSGGRCTIANVPPGTWLVRVSPVAGTAGRASSVRIESGTAASVVLRVTLESSSDAGSEAGDAGTAEASSSGLVIRSNPVTFRRTDAISIAPADAGSTSSEAGSGASADAGTSAADAGDGRSTACSPSSGADGGTTSGSTDDPCVSAPADAGTTTPDVTLTMLRPASTDASAIPAAPPDRSTGTFLALQGRTSDSRGRAVDGSVTVLRDGAPVGRAATAGGRYALYDLPQGSLTVVFQPAAGSSVTRTATYSGNAITVNFSVPSP